MASAQRMRRQLLACGTLLTLLGACGTEPPAPAPTTRVVTQTVTPTFTPTRSQPADADTRSSTATTGPAAQPSTAAPTPPTTATSPIATTGDEVGRVVKVYDGDTITVDIQGLDQAVRILGIDAPERENKGLGIAGECYGDESGADLRAKLLNSDVTLQVDPAQGDGPNHVDKYNRLLRYVQAQTQTGSIDVGAYQLQAGNAWVYEQYPVERTPEYMTEMQQAQADHAGLWAACE